MPSQSALGQTYMSATLAGLTMAAMAGGGWRWLIPVYRPYDY